MNLGDSPDEARFRDDLRRWLAENAPHDPLPSDEDSRAALVSGWTRTLWQGGWSGLSLPARYGGHGRSPIYDAILNEEIAAAGAPPISDSVYLAQVILAFGTDEQRLRWIPRMVSGDDWWCQGFSEPGAGSDLAALRTTAARDGDSWVIGGQKTWTTEAQWANWCLLLARTDPEAPRHRGISAFAVPMPTDGLEVRPIRQCTGQEEFAELFLDDVRVPDANMIGAPGDGWRLAMRTVTLERGPSDTGYTARHLKLLHRLEQHVMSTPGLADDRSIRQRLARSYVDVEILRVRVLRSLGLRAAGQEPGPESSTDKLIMIRTEQALHHLALALMGAEVAIPEDPSWLEGFLYSRAASVYGGTEQIQKEILATRVLGLPRG